MNGSRGNLVSAIRGPIMLITIGTLFAVDHFGPYSFGHTWPVILIVLGLMALIERATKATPAAGDPK